LCAAVLLGPRTAGSQSAAENAAELSSPSKRATSNFPCRYGRAAGPALQQTYFLDLDNAIQSVPLTLADPYRGGVDSPQVTFKLALFTEMPVAALEGRAGSGLVLPRLRESC